MRFNLLLIFFITSVSFAQDYDKALKCFFAEDYVCAKNQFSNVITNELNLNSKTIEYSQYYLFLSSLCLYNEDTQVLFDNFINTFPFSEKKEDAIFFMSEYLFEKKKYHKVVDLLSGLNLYQLKGQQKYFAFFYLGYSSYKIHKYELAKNSFYELIVNSHNPYRDDAVFYNAYILFLEGNKELALSGFQSLKNSKKYLKQVPYYISKILFDLRQYSELSNYLEPILDSNRCDHYQDLVLLQAKALYQEEKYDPAIVYFEEYKGLKDTLTRSQLYHMGIAYYHKKLYGFAINHLNKIILNKGDSLSQSAFYYLGDSYRKTQNRIEAMNAFRSASLIEWDVMIQHDAFYQFAILCYEQNSPLYDPVQYLSEFIEMYPNSEHVNELYSCLANTYLNTYNYDSAIGVLEQSDFPNEEIKEQYQKICFHKGVQLYNDGDYNGAILYFDKSISMGVKNQIIYDSYYWKAESYYNLKFYIKALNIYSKLYKNHNDLYVKSLYSQGYCYLKNKDYEKAIEKFKSFLNYDPQTSILYDVYMRMGDSYFALMNYQLSVYFYDKALVFAGFEDDYASYKKSTAYVLLKDYNSAVQSFNHLINSFSESNYIDDAIFDLGNTYILAGNFELAYKAFSRIINHFSSSLFYAESKLKIGLVYYMQQKDNDAVDVLKNVIDEFPNTHISQEALHVIKNIYNEIGEVNKFLDLIQNVNHNYTQADLDSSAYYSSELQYMQKNYQNAITSFQSYLSYYPQGLFYIEANYYLYKSYEEIGDLENAIVALNNIVNEQENKYTVEGILNLAKMSYKLEKYISSERYFSQLLTAASDIAYKKMAILGLLESKFKLYQYNDVVLSIATLVENDLFYGRDESRIYYLKAYSLYKMNKNDQSLMAFKWLIDNTEGELRAEAFYYTALLLYNTKKHDQSQSFVFQLINELPGYEKWVQKGLLILAKNYIMQEDMFQAQHVLLELEKQSKNSEILTELRQILNTNFTNSKLDTLINKND